MAQMSVRLSRLALRLAAGGFCVVAHSTSSPGICAPRSGLGSSPQARTRSSGFGVCEAPVASFDLCLVDFWSWDFPLSLLYFRAVTVPTKPKLIWLLGTPRASWCENWGSSNQQGYPCKRNRAGPDGRNGSDTSQTDLRRSVNYQTAAEPTLGLSLYHLADKSKNRDCAPRGNPTSPRQKHNTSNNKDQGWRPEPRTHRNPKIQFLSLIHI